MFFKDSGRAEGGNPWICQLKGLIANSQILTGKNKTITWNVLNISPNFFLGWNHKTPNENPSVLTSKSTLVALYKYIDKCFFVMCWGKGNFYLSYKDEKMSQSALEYTTSHLSSINVNSHYQAWVDFSWTSFNAL